ncbi:MAG: class I SAM-dependent methyltransferase [Chloroflexi bacterium]|nr:class I SAM-dependent methyltransferase [Chloroflexota bacterium]MBV9599678.1 class I SAM-dependent methyltransferase [Chloroflexota bacterium]
MNALHVDEATPRLYSELADWYPMLSSPAEYAEDARILLDLLAEAAGSPPRSLLELGSGAGNTASHYKHVVDATLVDLSPQMLAVSQRLNPECEHRLGDMRSVRLGRTFDAVLVHDAVQYLTTHADLRLAMATAHAHCRPGGVALFAPDYTRETFRPATTHGGHDADGRGMRYLAWISDPDPTDTTYVVDFAYLFHETGRPTRSTHEQHVQGLFSRAEWLEHLEEVGFQASVRPFEHSELPVGSVVVFIGRRP